MGGGYVGGGGGGLAAAPDRTLYVGNLPYDATQEEVEVLITGTGAGPVVRVHLPMDPDGRKRGFGFVTMSSADTAKAAIEALRGADIRGRRLVVNLAHPKGERPAGGDRPALELRGRRRLRRGGGGYAGGGGGYAGGGGGGGYAGGGGGGGFPPPAPPPAGRKTFDDRRRKGHDGEGPLPALPAQPAAPSARATKTGAATATTTTKIESGAAQTAGLGLARASGLDIRLDFRTFARPLEIRHARHHQNDVRKLQPRELSHHQEQADHDGEIRHQKFCPSCRKHFEHKEGKISKG